MSWNPTPPKPGGGGLGGSGGLGGGGQRPGGGQPPGGQPPGGGGGSQPQGGHGGGQPQQQAAPAEPAKPVELTLYQLLQVDRDAHVTIIRYAYRFLAAQYHPDNGETGDAEKFRVITEAWKTLSDEGKRAAYDMSLGAQEQKTGGPAHKPQPKVNEFGRDSMVNIPKTGITWNEVELRLAILQVLLAARKKKPSTGGGSGKMLMDCLQIDNIIEIEFALWYLREKGWIEVGERVFMITTSGLDYLMDQLAKTQILEGPGKTEQKVNSVVNANLPARLQ